MATSVQITDTVTSYELVYDAATQAVYKAKYGAMVQMGQPAVLMHQPDFNAAIPVRGHDANRTVYLDFHVLGGAWDDAYDAIIDIKRMVDGANSQALRYHTDGDVNRVVLRIQQNGATNYTDIPILYGLVDDSEAYYSGFSELNQIPYNVRVALVVAPYGEGAVITLGNNMASSPHFIEDSDSNGLADGWALVNTPTTTIDTTAYLIGGKSQKCVTDTSTSEGISCTAVSVGSGQNFAAYVWVYLESGDDITIQTRNGAAVVLESKSYATDSDKTAVDAAGNTWYRFSFTDTTENANGVILYILRSVTDATQATTFYIDGAYIGLGQTAVPNGWCSCGTVAGYNGGSIYNRYDPETNGAYLNYMDFWGLPGDADAILKMLVQGGTGNDRDAIIMSAWSDGTGLAQAYQHWIDDDDLATGGTDWSQSTGTGTTSDSYLTYTAPISVSDITSYNSFDSAGNAWDIIKAQPVRIFAAIYASSSTPSLRIGLSLGDSDTAVWTDFFKPDTTSAFRLVDFGLLNFQDYYVDYPSEGGIVLWVDENDSGSGTVRIDFIMVLPTDQFVMTSYDDTYASREWIIDGTKGNVASGTDTGAGTRDIGSVGTMGKLKTGKQSTRIVFFARGDEAAASYEQYDIATVITPSYIQVIPRTRHLLGVS